MLTTTHTSLSSASKCRTASCYVSHSPQLRFKRTASSSSDTAVVGPAPTNGTSNGATTPTPATAAAAQPAPPAPPAFQPSSQKSVAATKLELLEELAALDRGTLATAAQRDRVEVLVRLLEGSAGAGSEAFAGSPAPVEGRWQLIYNSKAVFTASPFFAAFQNGLVQDQQIAEAIFAFTDAIPGAEIGTAMQTISLLSNSLISEVDMTVFPGLTGTVVTSSRVQVLSPTKLGLDVQSTRVSNSSFSPFLDGISVPVEQLMEAVRGVGVTRVIYDVTYVDEHLRVTRCGDQLLLHRRV